jgi:hypothetical protein
MPRGSRGSYNGPMRGSWLLPAFGLGAALLSASNAKALDCNPPPSYLLWSYPSSTTEVVPTDAVFRAFGYAGQIVVLELDGREVPSSAANLEVDLNGLYLLYGQETIEDPREIEFQRRYQYPLESSEFVPPEPLSPGEHEVVIRVDYYGLEPGSYETIENHRFTVRAEEQPRPASDLAISAVTTYTWNDQWGPPKVGEFPPPEALDGVCPIIAKVNEAYCDYGWWGPARLDLIESGPATRVEPPRGMQFEARVDIAASGPALGYLIGYEFVPEGCSAFLGGDTVVAWDQNQTPTAVSFYAQPVLATGLGAPHAFTGEVPIVESTGTRPNFQDTPSWCSLAAIGARTNGSDLAALALFVTAGALLRRSRGARQLPPRS